MTWIETTDPPVPGPVPPAGLPHIRHYLSLGDSISIDRYPGLDVQEREGLPGVPAGLGAASLLYRNADDRWPEFRGRDLVSAVPGIRWTDLTADGATTASVLAGQLPRVPPDLVGPVLITLTVGGNDLVGVLGLGYERPPPPGEEAGGAAGGEAVREGGEAVRAIARAAERIVVGLRDRLADPLVLLGTVYDPTDGTGDLGDGVVREDGLRALAWLNDRLREIARERGAVSVDIHDHFLGHGLAEPDPRVRWYWPHLVIEPSARGASEVRRLWVEALGM